VHDQIDTVDGAVAPVVLHEAARFENYFADHGRTVPSRCVTEPTIIAVDWSGAKGSGRHAGIWLCAKDGATEVSVGRGRPENFAGWARDEVVEHVISLPGPLIVGFDFSFGLPAWFATQRGCASIDEVWALASRDGEQWLEPTPPFWNRKGMAPPREQRFRRAEERYPGAKSVFSLVGAGMVGPGSVRGMPYLARLRAAGFAIWPFDAVGERTVVEIYPSVLRKHSPQHEIGPWISDDERDAVVSARVMWDQRETVAALRAATDPTTRLEGDIWFPTASS